MHIRLSYICQMRLACTRSWQMLTNNSVEKLLTKMDANSQGQHLEGGGGGGTEFISLEVKHIWPELTLPINSIICLSTPSDTFSL